MNSTTALVRVGGRVGYLFEGTLRSGVCFVPEECVEFRKNGPVEIDETSYLLGGWARKNALFNPAVRAHRLFPDPRAMLGHTESAEIADFLRQLSAADMPDERFESTFPKGGYDGHMNSTTAPVRVGGLVGYL